jgi:fused signal recognition particle receptor
MFGSLKKKLAGFFGTEEKPKKKSKKTVAAKPKKKFSKKKIKEITSPTKFNVGLQKFEPNIEALKEKERELGETEETSFFNKLTKTFTTKTLQKDQVDEIFMELELILLEHNVALEAVDAIHKQLQEDLTGIEVKKDNIQKTVIDSLKTSILNLLQEPPNLKESIAKKKTGPYTVIAFGINGAGKTTSLAKLAHTLKKQGISCVLAAADTFRAASIEQLETHAKKLKVPIIKHRYGSDPAAVVFEAKEYAKKNNVQVVLADTAGRMYTKANLMKEMEKIIRVGLPDLKIFVGESITGNDATEQARMFKEAIDIDGVILTKADVDDKAGTILSVSHITKAPIYFLGTGQKYEDLTEFKKKDVLKHLGLD